MEAGCIDGHYGRQPAGNNFTPGACRFVERMVAREHVPLRRTPAGDLTLLVWEGVSPQQQADHMASVLVEPRSKHERYLRDRVLPELHGVDAT
jgi:hypothetical protein